MTHSMKKQHKARLRQLRKHLTAVTTPGPAAALRAAIDVAREYANHEEPLLQRILDDIADRRAKAQNDWDGSEPAGPPVLRTGDAYTRGGRALLVLEAGTAAFLGTQVFAFPTLAAAAFGVGLTGVLFYAMQSALQVGIVDGRGTAQSKFGAAQRVFGVSFGVWLGSVTLALSIARLPWPVTGYTVRSIYVVLLTLITLAAPAAAAALAVARQIRNAPDAEADLYLATQQTLDRVKNLRATCDRIDTQSSSRRNRSLVA